MDVAHLIHNTDDEDTEYVSLERFNLTAFIRNFTDYRMSDIGVKLTPIDNTKIQLPNSSVLHIIDRLNDNPLSTINPDIHNPFIVNESFPVYMHFNTSIPQKSDPLFPVTDSYRILPNVIQPKAIKYFQEVKTTKRVMNLKDTLERDNVMTVINYNPLLTMRMSGARVLLRKFDIILRSILHTVASTNETKYNFIQVPLSDSIYRRDMYTKAIHSINPSTVKIYDDMSFYFLLHLVSFAAKGEASLFNKLPDSKLETTFVILTHANKAVIYNLYDLKTFSEKNNILLSKVITHINRLKLVATESDVENISEADVDKLMTEKSRVEQTDKDDKATDIKVVIDSEMSNQVSDVKEVLAKDTTPHNDAVKEPPKTHQEEIAEGIQTVIKDSAEILTDEQIRKLADNVQFKNVMFGNTPINVLLSDQEDPKIGETIDALTNLPDSSMATSSVMTLDKVYIEKMLHRDIAAVLTSFSSIGMVLTNLKKEDLISPISRISVYTVTFTDKQGRNHNFVLKLPIIDKNGIMYIDGIKSRMIKQEVNVPICKISPTRVNLSSNYNKTLVERVDLMRHRFDVTINEYISKLNEAGLVNASFGKITYKDKLPYDYACVARRYEFISWDKNTAFLDFKTEDRYKRTEAVVTLKDIEKIKDYEAKNDVIYCGMLRGKALFFRHDNSIDVVNLTLNKVEDTTYVSELFSQTFGDKVAFPKMPSEWTELKILDKNFPIAFILGYKFGITKVMDMLRLKYMFYAKGERVPNSTLLVRIPFADGTLVFNRYPLEKSLIMSGFTKFETDTMVMGQLDIPDGYFVLVNMTKAKKKALKSGYDAPDTSNKGANYLKGIDGFFSLFIDPITKDILIRMGEPTTVKGLLIRATEMLATSEFVQTSSAQNHRFRSYERLADTVYNSIARNLANYNVQKGQKKAFSINPEEIFQRIVQDAATQVVEEINPMHAIKTATTITFSGGGGRSGRSFVVNDRIYPPDAVGIISECTPDSGKVAINAYTTGDPKISNIRGMCEVIDDKKKLKPTNIYSATTLLMPHVSCDDR